MGQQWFQNKPERAPLPESIQEWLDEKKIAVIVNDLPGLVPEEMIGDARACVEVFRRFQAEMREWDKKQPYSISDRDGTIKFFESGPVDVDDIDPEAFRAYKRAVSDGASEVDLRAMAREMLLPVYGVTNE